MKSFKTYIAETAAWTRKEGKNPEGGLNAKGVASYRRENPGSKLSMAVTTPPSKLKAGSKAANRRKSFCARMSGVDGPMKKPNGEPTRKALALKKWNCRSESLSPLANMILELSSEKLAQYKKAASADASAADKSGNFQRGNKRYSGIIRATMKQFDNDAKKREEK